VIAVVADQSEHRTVVVIRYNDVRPRIHAKVRIRVDYEALERWFARCDTHRVVSGLHVDISRAKRVVIDEALVERLLYREFG